VTIKSCATHPHHGVHLVLDGAQEAADAAESGGEVVERRQHRRQRHALQPPAHRLPLLLLRLLSSDALLLRLLLAAMLLLLHWHLQAGQSQGLVSGGPIGGSFWMLSRASQLRLLTASACSSHGDSQDESVRTMIRGPASL
jgi:hypothetical protein